MRFNGASFIFQRGDVVDRRKPTKRTVISHAHRHIRYQDGVRGVFLVPEGQFECFTVHRDGAELSPSGVSQ
jgi:hypothetical protein